MTDTIVAYHAEDEWTPARPAINVKDHNGGSAYIVALNRLVGPAGAAYVDEIDYDSGGSTSIAYDRVQSDFWQAAQEIATQKGLGEIEQRGRSGGWLVFTSFDPGAVDMERSLGVVTATEVGDHVKEWLAGYRSMVEWADAFIADAPRKVAALAQQLAMDEAGEEPARRAFAFSPSIPAATWAYEGAAPRGAFDPRASWPVDHAEGE